MIDAKQIPDEVVEAAMDAWGRPGTMKDVIAAALNAWPGVCKSESVCGWSKWIELPIEEQP